MSKKIRVAIVGCGNCAKSLVEGVQYYIENPDDKVGLMYEDIGGYTPSDLLFVCGFDVDIRKVNRPLKEALRAKPNCAMDHVKEISDACIEKGAIVYSGPTLDGVAPYMLDFPEEVSFRTGAIPAESYERVVELLKYHKVDVLINYCPVGSEQASRFYIDAAIDARCHVINCIPSIMRYPIWCVLSESISARQISSVCSNELNLIKKRPMRGAYFALTFSMYSPNT